METFEQPIKKEGPSLLEKTQEEFDLMVGQAKDLKEQGEHYNPNLASINPEFINEEEANLWKEIKAMKTKEDYQRLLKEIGQYRDKARTMKPQDINDHKDFIAYIGNMIMVEATMKGIFEE